MPEKRYWEQEGKPSETDSIKFKISSKKPRGKKDRQKDTIIDITSDSQVNSNFPYRWSPASLTFNNYFYLFTLLYGIFRHTAEFTDVFMEIFLKTVV